MVQILLDYWGYQRRQGLQLYGYVVLENHCHFVAQADRLDKFVHSFKSYTARQMIDMLKKRRAEKILTRLQFAKKAHKHDREFQFWQEGSHAELILNENMMREKLAYIHMNPVKRGYVEKAEYWRYSSAGFYLTGEGLVEIDRWC